MLAPTSRVLTPHGDEHRFTEACFALSTATRVAILSALMHANEPLHIREIARRVETDASPVRGHLELLAKTGFVRELHETGRERRFVANISGIRLVLTPPERPTDVAPDAEEPKVVRRITAKIKELESKQHRIELELAKLGDARAKAWRGKEKEA